LRQAGGDGQRRIERITESQHQCGGGQGLAEDNNGHHRQYMQRLVDQYLRVEEHAHRDKEQYGEGIAQR
jgi:hypothetical protein